MTKINAAIFALGLWYFVGFLWFMGLMKICLSGRESSVIHVGAFMVLNDTTEVTIRVHDLERLVHSRHSIKEKFKLP